MLPRPYQFEGVDRAFDAWREERKILGVAATGMGKTVLFSLIMQRFFQQSTKRALVIAHREELIWQAANKIHDVIGIEPEIEMADLRASHATFSNSRAVIATVQTLTGGKKRRLARFNPDDYGLVIIDEAHHSIADGYMAVINHFAVNPETLFIGVTATPKRADKKALGQVFKNVAWEYDLRYGIDNGWLVRLIPHIVPVDGLDISMVGTVAGDLNAGELSEQLVLEKPLLQMAAATVEICCGMENGTIKELMDAKAIDRLPSHIIDARKTLIFTASVEHADRYCEILNRFLPGSARWVSGETPREERRQLWKDYAAGKFQFLVNCGVACLDDQTEILTSDGWVGHKEISYEHEVANWKDGVIHFAKPLAIEVRDRRPDERMVVLETKNRSIRVTEDHRMLFRTAQAGRFKVSTAGEIVDRAGDLPISGVASPRPITAVPETGIASDNARRVSANSYALRKNAGLSRDESIVVAKRRIEDRTTLQYADPSELTEQECEFIGFWLGDGTVTELQSGGVEYQLFQSASNAGVCRWLDDLVAGIGFNVKKRTRVDDRSDRADATRWCFARGTGFGPQRRRGVYRIESYLKKDGSELYWGLNVEQFAALCRGLWMADGDHGQADQPVNDQWRISNTNRKLFDLLQAIACCRGFRASITDGKSNASRNPNHQPLWKLSITRRDSHRMTKYRMQFEEGWKAEKVWCVKSETGFIVTRRRGTVVITGNTEGFDEPTIKVIVMARMTKSTGLFCQIIGRGTRPLPGVVDDPDDFPFPAHRVAKLAASDKPSVEIIDFKGNFGRHRLVRITDILGGKYDPEVVDRAHRIIEQAGKIDADVALERAQKEVDADRVAAKAKEEADRAREAARRASLVGSTRYTKTHVDPFEVLNIKPPRDDADDADRPVSANQAAFLEQSGISTQGMTFKRAQQLVFAVHNRRRQGLCSFGQAKILSKRGMPTNVTSKEASRLIDEIAQREGWKPREKSQPRQIVAPTVERY